MIIICNKIMIVIILIINIINIKPASEIYMDGNVPLTITSIDIFSPYSYLTIQLSAVLMHSHHVYLFHDYL